MPLAWEAKLSPSEATTFKTLYGKAKLTEGFQAAMFKLVMASKAPGTISSYKASINRWLQYADKNGFSQFPPRPQQFAMYITHLSENKASYSTFKILKAAILFLHSARNSDQVCVTKTPFVSLVLEGAMRTAAKHRGPVKKARSFKMEEVREFLQLIFWRDGSITTPNPSLKDWRTGVRLYTYYMTLCRFVTK